MRFAVYVAVLMITLGGVLLGLDWQPAPMSPMVDTEAGLHGPVSLPLPPPTSVSVTPPTAPLSAAPKANIGAPIVPPKLVAPANPAANPATNPPPAAAAQSEAPASIATPEPQPPQPPPNCNVDACTAAYRSFTAVDCTYQPSNGPRRLCTKQPLPAIR